MLNNVSIGKHYPIKSKIHQMDPFAKILCLMIFLISCIFASNMKYNILLFILILVIILLSNIPLKYYIKTILSIKYILIFTIIINFIFRIDIYVTILTIFRIILLMLYTTILTMTTKTMDITYGLEKLFSPLKIFKLPIRELSFSLSTAICFIPKIIDQADKILRSQASRGVDYQNSNFKGKVLAIKSLIMPMFILTIKKADKLAESMEVRFFNINEEKRSYGKQSWNMFDKILIFIHIIVLIGGNII